MPSLTTHYLIADDVLKTKKLDFKLNRGLFNLGCQGPDVLFYLKIGILPTPASKRTLLGTTLHQESPHKEIKKMVDYANKQKQEDKDLLFSFILGYMAHYGADQVFHPFVFYRTGFKLNDDTYNYDFDHITYESMLDYEFINYYKMRLNKIKSYHLLKAKSKEVRVVDRMFTSIYRDLIKNDYLKSWQKMKLVAHLTYDPLGIKDNILRKFKLNRNTLAALIIPSKKRIDDNYDYLNLKKEEWKNPGSLMILRLTGVELLELAKSKIKQGFDVIIAGYQGQNILDTINQMCQNLNYYGINENTKMKEFKSIYKIVRK